MTKSIGMLVAGDISPTHTKLALCGLDLGHPVVVVSETVVNKDYLGLAPMVHAFLTRHRPPQIRGAAFVVPGPVQAGIALAANLPWAVQAEATSAQLGIDKVTILNDVEATGHAIPNLATQDILALGQNAAPDPGHQVILSIGDCPAISVLVWNGTEHVPFVSEGAHADFAPGSEPEARLVSHALSRVPRATLELMLSTSGLELMYGFLRGTACRSDADVASVGAAREVLSSEVVRRALAGEDPVCKQTIEMFLRVYGSTAANVALTARATGGVYLAGSLVPMLREPLVAGGFRAAFCNKAPMNDWLSRVPVWAVMSDGAPLLGAAAVAARDLRSRRVGGWAS